jgi:hypothetical protein
VSRTLLGLTGTYTEAPAGAAWATVLAVIPRDNETRQESARAALSRRKQAVTKLVSFSPSATVVALSAKRHHYVIIATKTE